MCECFHTRVHVFTCVHVHILTFEHRGSRGCQDFPSDCPLPYYPWQHLSRNLSSPFLARLYGHRTSWIHICAFAWGCRHAQLSLAFLCGHLGFELRSSLVHSCCSYPLNHFSGPKRWLILLLSFLLQVSVAHLWKDLDPSGLAVRIMIQSMAVKN